MNAIMTAWQCGGSAHSTAGDVGFSDELISKSTSTTRHSDHFDIRVLSKDGSALCERVACVPFFSKGLSVCGRGWVL